MLLLAGANLARPIVHPETDKASLSGDSRLRQTEPFNTLTLYETERERERATSDRFFDDENRLL